MKKPRVLYITNLGLLDNLAQTQILPYLEGLSKNGTEISILSFEKSEYLNNTLKVNGIKKRLLCLGINWDYLIYHRRWGNILDLLAGFLKTFRIVKNRDIHILHARASIPIIIAWPLAKILRRKIIYDRRGTMAGDFVDDVNVRNIFSIKLFAAMLETMDNFMMRHSDCTVVLSEKALKSIKDDKRFSNIAIENIPCCVDLKRFGRSETAIDTATDFYGRFIIAYIGSLGTCYLLEEMVRFFKILKRKKADALFLVISHTDRGYIEDIMEKERLKEHFGYVIIDSKPEDVPVYISQSKFSMMFIKPVACKIGSSPTKFGESLAAGVPVIVNKGIGDTEDIIRAKKVGVVIEDFDSASYQKTLTEMLVLLEDKDLKNRCVNTARDLFSLELGIERYISIYNRLMNK